MRQTYPENIGKGDVLGDTLVSKSRSVLRGTAAHKHWEKKMQIVGSSFYQQTLLIT
jgi:hypothetical protein